MSQKIRTEIKNIDVENIEKIIESTQIFSSYEVLVAKELIMTQLNNPFDSYRFLFLEKSDIVVAYTCFGKIPCTENNYDLYWIAVEKKYQNFGFGKKLLEETEKLVKNENGASLYIETSSAPKYEPTRQFYLKNGYVEIARFADFYKIGSDKIVYQKKLKQL